MASYEWLLGEPTIQVLSSDLVRDAWRVTARASDSQIVYSLLFAPYPTDAQGTIIWTDQLIASQLSYWAGIWNQNAQVPGVAGIGITQEIRPDGRLEDVALVTVQSTSGLSSTQLTLGPREWLPSTAGTTLTRSFGDAVSATRAQLDAAESGGVSTTP